jgi:hypothetical protein
MRVEPIREEALRRIKEMLKKEPTLGIISCSYWELTWLSESPTSFA